VSLLLEEGIECRKVESVPQHILDDVLVKTRRTVCIASRLPFEVGHAIELMCLMLALCRVFVYHWMSGFCNGEIGMRQQRTLRERIEGRIARRRHEDVFLPREFADLGGEDQVLRALRQLVREKRLVRLGYGVYGRAVVSRLSGEPLLYSANGFLGAARQALNKLGVAWEATEAERAYNQGRSTQVPINPVVRVKGRFSRRLRDGNLELVLER
jgi:hypothetical protein